MEDCVYGEIHRDAEGRQNRHNDDTYRQRALQEEYNRLAAKTNRSRNELIGMALQYALDHMELKNCGETGNLQPL